jgi:hypothetical protein
MSNETLFADGSTPPEENKNAPATPSIPDNVKDLIGEGKKYATVEMALEALGHAQSHIQKIETENSQLRDVATKAVDSETVYATVKELLKQERQTNAPAVDVASIESLLDRKLTERETRLVETANADKVRDALVAKFGDKEKAQEMFDAKAKELGVGKEFLTSLAKKSPKAALELLGIKEGSTQSPNATHGTMRTEQLRTNVADGAPKTVMSGATSAEMIAAWRASAPKTS